MKKPTRTTRTAQSTPTLVLAEPALRAVVSGTDGTIISENIAAHWPIGTLAPAR